MNNYCALLISFLISVLLPTLLPAEELQGRLWFTAAPMTVTATPGEPLPPIIEFNDPGISAPVYAVKGLLSYADVEGDGYLQLDNYFEERGVFFTKSIAPDGPLGKISGSSDWRPFVLPFSVSGDDPSVVDSAYPDRLLLTLHLPGSGTVSIRDVGLYQYTAGENPLQTHRQWFDSRVASLFGGIGGTVFGLWGALIGVLSSRGKARHFALGSAHALMLVGICCIGGAAAAFATGQADAVSYSLLILGFIGVVVIGGLRRTLAARYEQVELQRMQSMDA